MKDASKGMRFSVPPGFTTTIPWNGCHATSAEKMDGKCSISVDSISFVRSGRRNWDHRLDMIPQAGFV